jgi:LmbE family N-acetylglucosaminyl deacetylase/glycosyltransferase involved in cell wall biosynthesis
MSLHGADYSRPEGGRICVGKGDNAISMSYPELDLLPFEATALLGERLLVLAPHPDDEVIGCGGLIALHALEKRSIRVVVLSDGAEGSADRQTREEETRTGLRILGAPEPRFVGLPDRQLASHSAELGALMREEILGVRPDLIACPAPTEVHPDHAAVARALVELLHNDFSLVGETAVARIAFYEVSQPFRPNTLLDITRVADAKFRAVRAHASQLGVRDYDAYARGLNRYRSMTLPAEARYAEAYWVAPLASLHTISWSDLRERLGPAHEVEIVRETQPVTVIVRTKDRLPLLGEALQSIAANDYPSELVVVNDGGASPAELVRGNPNALLIEHLLQRGRSEAMNAGVRAAATPWIAFLDDDDLFYADHLRTLASGMGSTGTVACYTDALSVFMELSEKGLYEPSKRLRIFAQPFDRELLLIDNYIPLPTLMVRRDDFLDLGGFDPAFDLFEDWDFLLRLSARGNFTRIPRLTCEIRHFPAGGSIIVDTPESSEAFRSAKLEIWRRHFSPPDPNVIANVFERQKKAVNDHYGRAVEERGRARHLEVDIDRFMREKELLISELQKENADRNAAVAELSGLQAETDGLRSQIEQAGSELDRLASDLERVSTTADERDDMIRQLYAEIERLNAMLDTIHRSRTWKLHSFMENLRGRH